jgi:hypothetical protein
MRLEQSWCPNCLEWTSTDAGRPCVWCDTRTIAKRGGWKRPDLQRRSRVSPSQARAIHAAHQAGRSLRDLSDAVWEALGYASAKSCLEGIRSAFAREGLTARSRADGTRLSNTQRSMRLPGEDNLAFRRRRRREHGYRDGRTGEWRIAS